MQKALLTTTARGLEIAGFGLIGQYRQSCGPFGTSTGLFKTCKTVTPLTEIADRLGVTLIGRNGQPVPRYL